MKHPRFNDHSPATEELQKRFARLSDCNCPDGITFYGDSEVAEAVCAFERLKHQDIPTDLLPADVAEAVCAFERLKQIGPKISEKQRLTLQKRFARLSD